MAKNYVQEGRVLNVAEAGASSGDHIVLGSLNGVALTDTDADGDIRMAIGGVFDLSVFGDDDGGNVAVNVGDKVYDDGGTLNVDATNGTLFGIALEAVGSGNTTTIQVLIVNPA